MAKILEEVPSLCKQLNTYFPKLFQPYLPVVDQLVKMFLALQMKVRATNDNSIKSKPMIFEKYKKMFYTVSVQVLNVILDLVTPLIDV